MKMGRYPKVQAVKHKKKGGWSEEEDKKLKKFIKDHGFQGLNWKIISQKAGLNRCGKSCRLRWKNYLNPHIKRGNFSDEEKSTIIHYQSLFGNKWSEIAKKLPGRTDNDIKNLWNTKLGKIKRQSQSSQSQIPLSTDHFLPYYTFINNIFSYILQFPEIAQNLLLIQEWETKQQEMMMAPSPICGFDDIAPLELHTNYLASDPSFGGELSAVSSNYDITQVYDHMQLPPLISAVEDEFPMPTTDEFFVINPNSMTSNFEYDQWMESHAGHASSSNSYDHCSSYLDEYFQS